MDLIVTEAPSDVTVVSITGTLSGSHAASAGETILDLIRTDRRRIVIDLQGVDFMDSSALGAIVAAFKAARGAGGDVRIARPSWQAMLVFQLTNMDQIFTFYDEPTTAYSEG